MPTLLLPPRFTDDSIKLWRAAIAAGWNTQRLGRWHVDDDLRSLNPSDIAVYGGFFIALANQMGISLLEPSVDWLARLPRAVTKRSVRFMTLHEARTCTERAFYKPADDKTFLAKIYENGSELPAEDQLPPDLPVLVSDIVSWAVEFRCFVLDGKVATLSPYLRNQQRLETDDGAFPASDEEFTNASHFAATLLADHAATLPSAVVVDVGLIADQGWAVVEANTAWGAGIYGCDPAVILPILRRGCVATADLTSADRRWLTAR
jgi:hypothetical protein